MEFLSGHIRSSEKRAIALYWQPVNDFSPAFLWPHWGDMRWAERNHPSPDCHTGHNRDCIYRSG